MKVASTLFLFVVVGCTWRETIATCVFESDFGFTFNCAFKKSGIFRVRNLGGIKGYVGLGLTVGDELGFRESLSNLEAGKRRSLQTRGTAINLMGNRNDIRRVVPPFKPLPPGNPRPMLQQPERQRLVVQQNATNVIRTVPAPTLMMLQEDSLRQQQRLQQENLKQQQRLQHELLAIQVLKQQRLQQQEAMRQQQKMQAQAQMLAQQQMLASQIKRIQVF